MMEMFNHRNYSKALVIGAGGGRDMASCILITEKLRKLKIGVDLAGFLTPWALHTFDGELEKPVNELTGKKSRKFIASRRDFFLDSYFEPELVKLNREFRLGIGRFFLFSLHYGTEELKGQLKQLIKNNAYDALIAVDVGGDILARKKDYSCLLTPIVDFSCLSILASLCTEIDCHLILVGPGVDGEIPWQNLIEIFDELESKGLVLGSERLRRDSSNYQAYQRVHNHISSHTHSHSNTFRLIEKALASTGTHMSETLEKRASVKERRWTLRFPLELSLSLAKAMYYFNLTSIHAIRDVRLGYENVFEAFLKLKQLGAGGTEVDLAFIPRAIEGGKYEDTIFLLTPPERLTGKTRQAILEYGLKLTGRGDIPCSVMLEKDARTVSIPPNLDIVEKWDGLCAVCQSRFKQALFETVRNGESA